MAVLTKKEGQALKQKIVGADRLGRWMHDFDRKLDKARERQEESNKQLIESRKEKGLDKTKTRHTLADPAQDPGSGKQL